MRFIFSFWFSSPQASEGGGSGGAAVGYFVVGWDEITKKYDQTAKVTLEIFLLF